MPAKRVLCVEDDADTRYMLKMMLGYSDFEAVAAPDADAALRLMERERFSLYVLDGGLRRVRGLSLCERIRAADSRTPIIIFSGHGKEADRAAGLRAGANAYILKPGMQEIVPTVKRLLEQAQVPAF